MKEADGDAKANKEGKNKPKSGRHEKKIKLAGFTDVGRPAEYKANSGKQSN